MKGADDGEESSGRVAESVHEGGLTGESIEGIIVEIGKGLIETSNWVREKYRPNELR